MMELENKDIVTTLSDIPSPVDGQESFEGQELLPEDSFEFNKQVKNLSAEDYEKLANKLAQEGKKTITVKPLLESEKSFIADVLSCLKELKSEVLSKQHDAVGQSLFIKEKVSSLVTSGKVLIHQDEYKKSEESVTQYAGLLDNIVIEIDSECDFFNQLVSDSLPPLVIAWANEPDNFNDYVMKKVRFVKKYIKSIRKDLNISFSRYNFGFQAQFKRILHVVAYIRYHENAEFQSQEHEQPSLLQEQPPVADLFIEQKT